MVPIVLQPPDMGIIMMSLTIQFKILNLGIYEEEHVYGGIIGNENWGIDGHFHVQILSEYYSIDSPITETCQLGLKIS